ncbi:unnamed protein product [Rotaria sp. Silwood2]|nr:unnamed protein product [Rotaria sp. Silwood2]CAF2908473.1 unnamed protein product [Rotaria sp. Silwood2]CAF4071634.1 unnamed protein product [Rotaria sp. Silwood2]CAF4196576.1 unnamed protein product [Rotaria sp. Silwood2]
MSPLDTNQLIEDSRFQLVLRRVLQEIDDKECRSPLPLTVYYSEQVDLFMAHQQTSDTRLFMLHILKSKAQMIAEFRRMCNDNQATLDKIDVFKNTYNSNTAV